MQLSFFFPLGMMLTTIASTAAEDSFAPMYQFNHGNIVPHSSCSAAEWDIVQDAMLNAVEPSNRRRRLGEAHRNLSHRCGQCSYYSCFYLGKGCVRGRRRRQLDESNNSSDIVLPEDGVPQDHHKCNVATTAVDTVLMTVPVSSSCRALLDAPRKVSCVPMTTDCQIHAVSLYSSTSDSVLVPDFPATGGVFCKSQRVTFRAEATFNLGRVQFVVHGPRGYMANRTEYKAPYYMHGNEGADVHGTIFPVGNYNMTITSQFHTAKKVVQFRSIKC